MSLKNCKRRSPPTPRRPLITVIIASFPASEAFDAINQALTASDADRKDAIKQGNAVFAFTLKNKAGETESWNIDLKNKGEAGKDLGDKPTGERLYIVRAAGMEGVETADSTPSRPFNSVWFHSPNRC